jgi:hypothetical protein
MGFFMDSHVGHALCAFGVVLAHVDVHVLTLLEICVDCFFIHCLYFYEQLYAAHVEEPEKTKGPSLEDFSVLQEFEDVFQEIPGLPPKRDIDFSIDLVPGVSLVSKTPYRMSTP